LDPKGLLTTESPSSGVVKYDSLASGPGKHRAEFDIRFDKETEITGYASAKLFMSCQTDDMHVFVTLWKLDTGGQPVGMTYYAQVCSCVSVELISMKMALLLVDGLKLLIAKSIPFQPQNNLFCSIGGNKNLRQVFRLISVLMQGKLLSSISRSGPVRLISTPEKVFAF
jgi:hypothetical protein